MILASKPEVIEILLVEDDPGDVRLTQEAIRDCGVVANISIASDGGEAMAYLRREGRYGDARRPTLILLDMNLPGKDGREVLAEIKAEPDLRRIPVVVLAASQSEDDIAAAYGLHANCYVPKPADIGHLIEVVRCIEDFWLTKVRLPAD